MTCGAVGRHSRLLTRNTPFCRPAKTKGCWKPGPPRSPLPGQRGWATHLGRHEELQAEALARHGPAQEQATLLPLGGAPGARGRVVGHHEAQRALALDVHQLHLGCRGDPHTICTGEERPEQKLLLHPQLAKQGLTPTLHLLKLTRDASHTRRSAS